MFLNCILAVVVLPVLKWLNPKMNMNVFETVKIVDYLTKFDEI